MQSTHRFHTIKHEMQAVEPILNGKYLELPTRIAPPKALAESGIPLPALQIAQTVKQEA